MGSETACYQSLQFIISCLQLSYLSDVRACNTCRLLTCAFCICLLHELITYAELNIKSYFTSAGLRGGNLTTQSSYCSLNTRCTAELLDGQ